MLNRNYPLHPIPEEPEDVKVDDVKIDVRASNHGYEDRFSDYYNYGLRSTGIQFDRRRDVSKFLIEHNIHRGSFTLEVLINFWFETREEENNPVRFSPEVRYYSKIKARTPSKGERRQLLLKFMTGPKRTEADYQFATTLRWFMTDIYKHVRINDLLKFEKEISKLPIFQQWIRYYDLKNKFDRYNENDSETKTANKVKAEIALRSLKFAIDNWVEENKISGRMPTYKTDFEHPDCPKTWPRNIICFLIIFGGLFSLVFLLKPYD